MQTIDIHTHILPPRWPDLQERYGYGGFVSLEHIACDRARMMIDGKFFREIESNCWDPERRLHECDAHGVGLQVISTVPVMFSYWAKPEHGLDLSQLLNDHLAGVVAGAPSRFLGLGTLPMQSPAYAIRELERCKTALGFPGVQIGSNVNGKNLNAPEVFAVLEAAQDLDMCVFVHPWEVLGRDRLQQYWGAWLIGMPAETALAISAVIFGGVLERLPRLRLAFAHGGGSFPGTAGRIAHGFEARPDLCAVDNPHPPLQYTRKIFYDALVHAPEALRYLVDFAGADRVALGSDYPFPLGEERPGTLIRSCGFSPEVEAQLLSGTARAWLKR